MQKFSFVEGTYYAASPLFHNRTFWKSKNGSSLSVISVHFNLLFSHEVLRNALTISFHFKLLRSHDVLQNALTVLHPPVSFSLLVLFFPPISDTDLCCIVTVVQAPCFILLVCSDNTHYQRTSTLQSRIDSVPHIENILDPSILLTWLTLLIYRQYAWIFLQTIKFSIQRIFEHTSKPHFDTAAMRSLLCTVQPTKKTNVTQYKR